jgi:hypothetical protein
MIISTISWERVGTLGGRHVCNLVMMQPTVDLGFAAVPGDENKEVRSFAMQNKE